MAWEVRRGRKYYYRSRRVNGRVVKEYAGTGPAAEEAARLDAEKAAEKERQRKSLRETIESMEEMDRILAPLHELVDVVVHFAMTDAGYHKCRGEWRKKRVKREEPKPSEPTPPSV